MLRLAQASTFARAPALARATAAASWCDAVPSGGVLLTASA
ncbi:hypothetical protein [Microbacterium sp. NPDC058345]